MSKQKENVLEKDFFADSDAGKNRVKMVNVVVKARDAAVLVWWTLADLVKVYDHNWNPGKRGPNDHLAFIASICAYGLKEPLMVNQRSGVKKSDPINDKSYRGCKGHLRLRACVSVAKDYPEDFVRVFPNGLIPVSLVKGLDKDQEYFLACDHDTVSRGRVGIIQQGVEMFLKGAEAKEVLASLLPEINSAFGQVGDKVKSEMNLAKTEQDRMKIWFRARYGTLQLMKRLAELPDKVKEAFYNAEDNGKEGDKLTHTDITASAILNNKEGGTKLQPSQGFEELYATKVAAYGTAKDTGPKPKTIKELDAMGKLIGSVTYDMIFLNVRLGMKFELSLVSAQLIELEKAGKITFPEGVAEQVKAAALAYHKGAEDKTATKAGKHSNKK